MKRVILSLLAVGIALVTMAGLTAVPASAADSAAVPAPLNSIPVTGTTADGETFAGTVQPTQFVAQGREVLLKGLISGTMKNSSGGTIGTVSSSPVTMPVALPTATCPILHLTLGPLDLNLLGLKVHLDRVVLVDSITLMCADAEHTGQLVRDTQFREVAVAIFKPDRANGFSTDGGDQGDHNQGVAPESLSPLMR